MKLPNNKRKMHLLPAVLLSALLPLTTTAEDIDIFVAGAGGSGGANVLVIIDNTSNWSTNKQNWPSEIDPACGTKIHASGVQGQAELCALIKVVSTFKDTDTNLINIGLMLMNHNGSGNCCTGGYLRYAMRPVNGPNSKANRDLLITQLNQIFDNISDPGYTTASDASYSMALFDAFKYYGGFTSPKHATDDVAGAPTDAFHFGTRVFATPAGTFEFPDAAAYTDASDTVYVPPAPTNAPCGGKNYIIFIGNSFPNSDTPPQEDMSKILSEVGGTPIPQLAMPVLTTTTAVGLTDSFGASAACYNNNAGGLGQCNTDNAGTCGSSYDTCTCGTPTINGGCPGGKVKYTVTGSVLTTNVEPTGTTAPPAANKVRYADEWTKFLYDTDVSSAAGSQNVITFTIDAFNAKQNADQTALLYSMATAGHGQYYAAKNKNELVTDLGDIFAKIQATNDVFAAASLPISATNRAVNANEVYVGMFRPDPDAKPLWYGNLKRYQIAADSGGSLYLADVNKGQAVNPGTGFVDNCATSWWTSDSDKFWWAVSSNPSPLGKCTVNNPYDLFSDRPDGPQVEKGAVAEIIRQGNNPGSAPTWMLNRTLYTKAFVAFDKANSGMAQPDVDFVSGLNVDAAGNSLTYHYDPADASKTTTIRPTVHGDVVHARPMPVSYPAQTVIYYGANDGMFRAVDSVSGTELWAYVAPEFYSTLPRLRQNSPLINYSSLNLVGAQPKNYYFDGPIGLYQNADSSNVWIYPTMRRGGRMVYAFDVSSPTSPNLRWTVGCPNLADDTGCGGFDAIGQTWSSPNVAKLKTGGTVGETPTTVIALGGGYDNCEDGAPNNPCGGAKGSIVYLLDASDGSKLASFTTAGRVVADVVYVDLDGDQIPDLAYAADTRGNIYRISFGMSRTAPLAASLWTSTLIAYTTGSNRKFLYAPAVFGAYDKSTGKFYVYLALGTGDREQPLVTQYPYTTPVLNRFYLFMDDLSTTSASDLDSKTTMNDNTPVTACGSSMVLPGSGKSGWFMDLDVCGPDAKDCSQGATTRGEQTVTSAVIFGPVVAFSTNRAIPPKPNVCAPQGEARGYAVNLFNASGAIGVQPASCGGARSGTFAAGGLPPSPVVAAVCIGGTGDNCDGGKVENIGIGIVSLGGGASSGIGAQKLPNLPPQHRKRVYWRQEGDN
jgi:type IV pilus assembly protein PilY1